MLADNTETFNTHRFEDAAVLAARASGDHEIEALICKGLAAAYSGLGLYDKMLEYEQQALSIANETGDVEAECRAYCRLAWENPFRNSKSIPPRPPPRGGVSSRHSSRSASTSQPGTPPRRSATRIRILLKYAMQSR